MRNLSLEKHKTVGFAVLTSLMGIVTILAFLTYSNEPLVTNNPFLAFAVANHTFIMAGLVLVSVAFGFFWSFFLYKEIEAKSKISKSSIDVVKLFLGNDERKIIDFLVAHEGKTTQAEISRIEGLNKVKAFRCVKRMQEKQLIDVASHGKIRKVTLKDHILKALTDS